MYNGIGLQTPRGSGTNGYVTTNLAFIRHRKDKVEYKTEADLTKLDRALHKEPNKELLEHQWKRKIELQCMELGDRMEEQLYPDEEVEREVDTLRESLLAEGYKDLTTSSVDSHHMAAVNEKKNEKFRNAFGISQEYIGGSSFDPNRQAIKAAERETKRVEKATEKEKLKKEREKEIKTQKSEQSKKSDHVKDDDRKKRKSSDRSKSESKRTHSSRHYESDTSDSSSNSDNKNSNKQHKTREKLKPKKKRSNKHKHSSKHQSDSDSDSDTSNSEEQRQSKHKKRSSKQSARNPVSSSDDDRRRKHRKRTKKTNSDSDSVE